MIGKRKPKFYSLDKILAKNAKYNIIFGERSNGKTFSVLEYGIKEFFKNNKQMAIIRRWDEDFRGKRGQTMFSNLVELGLVEKYSDGEWTDIYYYGGKWFFCRYDEKNTRIMDIAPFCFAFSLSAMEHDKSTSYPNITTICFDEFISRNMYLPDEFVLFMNVLSTIIRFRTDVKIFMLGNTVNKYCPYFKEMGLSHVRDMQKGNIDIYTYGDSGLTVAVEFSEGTSKDGKESDVYFAFNNPKLNMITTGEWELDLYPHCPIKYVPKDIIFIFFISFDDNLLQCEIISKDGTVFIFIHNKTTPLKYEDDDLIYSTNTDYRNNWRRRINRDDSKIGKLIRRLFKDEKVFYQDNEIGEVVRNYMIWCGDKKVK